MTCKFVFSLFIGLLNIIPNLQGSFQCRTLKNPKFGKLAMPLFYAQKNKANLHQVKSEESKDIKENAYEAQVAKVKTDAEFMRKLADKVKEGMVSLPQPDDSLRKVLRNEVVNAPVSKKKTVKKFQFDDACFNHVAKMLPEEINKLPKPLIKICFDYEANIIFTLTSPLFFPKQLKINVPFKKYDSQYTNVVAFNEKEDSLIMGSDIGSINIWDIHNNTKPPTHFVHNAPIMALDPARNRMAIRAKNCASTKKIDDITPIKDDDDQYTVSNGGYVRTIVFHPSGNHFAVAGDMSKVHVWDIHNFKKHIAKLTHDTIGFARALAFNPTGNLLVTAGDYLAKIGGWKGKACLWDISKWESHKCAEFYHEKSIRAVAFNPTADHLATASEDGVVRLWNIHNLEKQQDEKQKHIAEFRNAEPIYALAFNPEGTCLMAASEYGMVYIWDIGNQEKHIAEMNHGNDRFPGSWDNRARITSLAFDAAGFHFATGGFHHSCLWDTSFLQTKYVTPDHIGLATLIAQASKKVSGKPIKISRIQACHNIDKKKLQSILGSMHPTLRNHLIDCYKITDMHNYVPLPMMKIDEDAAENDSFSEWQFKDLFLMLDRNRKIKNVSGKKSSDESVPNLGSSSSASLCIEKILADSWQKWGIKIP